MKAEQAEFRSLVDDAYSGGIRLPEFQRKWVWKRLDVLRLFDSVRKNYPIGGFLTLEASDRLNLGRREFEGVTKAATDIRAYVLDGQQRITAGLALYYGIGKSHYFLNLQQLWERANRENLDYDDEDCLREFAYDLDEGDEYIKGRVKSSNPESLLESEHLLWTPNLTSETKFETVAERYLNHYPDRARFIRRLVSSFFKISGSQPIVPVTVLDSRMPVEAITRVFEMLNTSGQRLTPVEIVVAVLFAQDIHLRQELEDFQADTTYYCNMESTGEIFLQTIALLAGENPKKNTLPKTIPKDNNYTKFKDDAILRLEFAGKFLSERFGIGLDATNRLVQYDAMLPPLGIALAEIERQHPQPSPAKEHWKKKMERWFVGSILHQEYNQSQPATQKRHEEELLRWIRTGDDFSPDWLSSVRVQSQDRVTPNSAIGKLIACLISQRKPRDPLNKVPVGGKGDAIISSQSHHIFPKGFCEDHIPLWDPQVDKHDLALNVMPLTKQTNRRWNKMDPANQITDVRNEWGSVELLQLYEPFFINERCLEIMKKPSKTKDDFSSFIKERGRLIREHITREWDFISDAEQQVEDEEEI